MNDEVRRVRYSVECIVCNRVFYVLVRPSDFNTWLSGNVNAQEIFTYLTPDERELLISSICTSCFDSLYEDN